MRKILKPIIGCICLVSLAACGSLSPKPPSWTNEMFSQDGSFLYFTGISDKHTSEVTSVTRAINFAEQGFARFCGVELDSYIEHLGSSEAAMGVNVDTSTSSSKEIHETQARIKQSVVAKRFTKEVGDFFKTWIVLAIPASQYNECQAYKEELAKEKNLEGKNSILTSQNAELNKDNDRLLNYQQLQLRVGQLEEQNNDLREEVRVAQQASFVDKDKARNLDKKLTSLKITHNNLIANNSVITKHSNDLDLGLLSCTADLRQSQTLERTCIDKLVSIKDMLQKRVDNMNYCNQLLGVFNN